MFIFKRIELKYIIAIAFFVIGNACMSQPITQRSSTVITVQDGNLFAQNSFRPAVYDDTSAANLVTSLDSCGKMIFTYTDNSYWLRACSPKRWIKILKTGDVSALTATQVAFGNTDNTITSEALFNYNSTNNALSADSLRTRFVVVNTDTLKGGQIIFNNTESNAGVDSVGRFGISQSETVWAWPRKDVVMAIGYNDPQALGSLYKANAGSLAIHFENDFFGLHEFILYSTTHSGFTNRHMFGHFNKYNGTSDFQWSISQGMQWFEYDSTSNPYFSTSPGNTTAGGVGHVFKVDNKNLHTGVVSGSFSIAPQGDGGVNLGTGLNTNIVSLGNTLALSTGNQYNITTTITNSNAGALQVAGSTTAASGYPEIISSEVNASGGTIFKNKNTHATGATANMIESSSAGDMMTIYRSGSNGNDFNTGYSASNNDFRLTYGASVLLGGTNLMTIKPNQRIGMGGITSPTARLHLIAGTTTANTAPLKIDSGVVLSSPELGAIENDGDSLYWTNRSGVRIALNRIGASATTLYTGDGTVAGNRNVNANNLNLTFSDVNTFRINMDVFAFSKADGTFPYSAVVVAPAQQLWLGYTSTVGTYNKGAAVIIDTNENVSLGTGIITSAHPLYTYGSAFAQGFTSSRGNFYRVDNLTADHTATVEQYWMNIDATSANVTVTLPAASTAFGSGTGIQYVFRRVDNVLANTVTISRAGSDTINGATTTTLTAQYQVQEIQAVSTSAWAIK